MGNSIGCTRTVIDEEDESVGDMSSEVLDSGSERRMSGAKLGSPQDALDISKVTPEDDNTIYIGMFSRGRSSSRGSRDSPRGRSPRTGATPRSDNDGVIRRAFSSLTARDQDRVVAAFDRMMRDGTFFKHGALHGWPSVRRGDKWGYCVHSYQRFPTWHREYLRGFELDMQRADRALGGDGRIGLPYWDWLRNPNFPRKMQRWVEYPREGIPAQYRDFRTLRPDLRERFVTPNGTFNMRVNTFIPNKATEVRGSFQLSHYANFSCKRGQNPGGFQDLESIHDSIHGRIGGMMGALDIAAYHPAFWLHHCMVDRLFETYVFYEPDSSSEMSRTEINTKLEPFGSTSRKDFLWRHDGYRYDTIATEWVPRSVQQNLQMNMMMRQNPGWQPPAPTLTRLGESPEHHTNPTKFPPETNVSFKVDVTKLQQDTWPVMIFAVPFGQKIDVPFNQPNMWARSRWLVGDSTILHSRELATCSACQDSDPFLFDVPVGAGLKRLGLSRNKVNFVIWFTNLAGQPFTAEDLYRRGILGGHVVTGPFFGDPDDLQIGVRSEDAKMLQLYLKVFGWYDGQIDGIFSEKTRAGVMGFQRFFGLKVDGLVGGRTKDFIVNKFRMDDEEDTNGDVVFWPRGSRVTYKVMSAPMYLDRNQLLREIDEAFDAWESFGNYDFVRVQHTQPADIEVSFQDHADFNIFTSEGRGGILARSDKNHIQFNEDEKWMLRNSQIPRLGGFYVYNVALHQVGKVIGLSNSPNPADAMYPFYNATKVKLNSNETQAAANMLAGKPMQAPHPRQAQRVKQVQKGTNDQIPLDTFEQTKARWQGGPPPTMNANQVPTMQKLAPPAPMPQTTAAPTTLPAPAQMTKPAPAPSPAFRPAPTTTGQPLPPATSDPYLPMPTTPASSCPCPPQPECKEIVTGPIRITRGPARMGEPKIIGSSCPQVVPQPIVISDVPGCNIGCPPNVPNMSSVMPTVMSSTDEFRISDAAPAPTYLGARGMPVDSMMGSGNYTYADQQAAEILSRPVTVEGNNCGC